MTRRSRRLRAVESSPEGAVLYVRQSVTRYVRDAEGNKTPQPDTVSPELQETAGRDYCTRQGYRVIAVVTDLNRTGRTLKRRKVQQAIGYLERGEASVIVAWKWSRMCRNRRDWAVTSDYVEEKVGGRLESSTEPVDVTTAVGKLNRGMLAEFAAFESDRAGEVWKEVADGRVARGLPGNGRERFGYVNVGKGHFEPHPELGQVLAGMYRRFVAGAGYRGVARWLNDHGYRTTRGGIWREEVVRSTLDSGFAAGRFRHRGVLLDGVHKPVITAEEWEEYLAVRDRRRLLPSRAKGSRYLLTGMVKCGVCGAAMKARTDRRGHAWYRCHNRTLSGCPNVTARLDRVEKAVLDWLTGLVRDLDQATEAAVKVRRKVVTHQQRAEVLARQVAQQEQALARLAVELARGLIADDETYVAARDEIVATRDRLRAEHAEAVRTSKAGARLDTATYRGLVAEWPTLPVATRREALRQILARVRVWGRPLRVEPVPAWEDQDTPTGDGTTVRLPHPRTRSGQSALTAEQVVQIRRRYAAGEPMRRLADEYGVSASTIWDAIRRRTYRTVPG